MTTRIVFLSIFRPGYGGGEGRVAQELARQFAAHYQTVLLCAGDRTEFVTDDSGLTVFYIKSSGQGDITVPLLNQDNVRRIFDFLDQFQPHIIHAHDPALLGVIGQVWARMHNVPFVYTAHVIPTKALDFGTREAFKIPKTPLTERLTDRISNDFLLNFYHNCDAVVALNQIVAEGIREFGYEGRIFVIPNGRDMRVYQQCRPAELSAPEKVLTFAGFVSRRKNQLYLLEMLTHLPRHYRLQLIGEFIDPQYEKQLRAYAAEHGLDNAVFLGRVRHEEIPGLLAQTHVLVSASRIEVQSLVVIEALASGTPVVGLSNETVDELVDDSVGCRLPKDTEPPKFAACVERLCSLPQTEYEQICEHARQRVAHLDWSNVILQTVQAYNLLRHDFPAVTDVDRARLRRAIALIPEGRVRQVLTEQVMMVASQVRRVRRVSVPTWLAAGLTMLGTLAAYVILRRPWKK